MERQPLESIRPSRSSPRFTKGPTVHVDDASKSVPVVGSLLSDEQRGDFLKSLERDYEKLREEHLSKQRRREYCTLAEARANKIQIDWSEYKTPKPNETGVIAIKDAPIHVIAEYIDWTPFFMTWDLKGAYPDIFRSPKVGTQARQLYDDAIALLKRMIDENILTAQGVIGLFPANSVNHDDIELYTDDSRKEVLAKFHTLRQQTKKRDGNSNGALADFIAPKETGISDYIGAFAVTTGIGLEPLIEEFESQYDDYNSIMAKALADRLAEAFAEYLHAQVRQKFWGYATEETFTSKQLIRERYQGIRPAAGYPACPDHTEKKTLFRLLSAETNADIHLTESYAMMPGAAVSGLYFTHEKSHYFGLGKIGKDQAHDYAERKGMTIEEIERWLQPNLNYT